MAGAPVRRGRRRRGGVRRPAPGARDMSTARRTRRPGATKKRRRSSRRRPTARQRAVARSRRKRMLLRIALSVGAVVVVAGLAVLIPRGLAGEPSYCAAEPLDLPADGIEGWQGEQLQNAATIMTTATALGFGRDGQILGVMTAMGESSLRNIDYGDWETSGFTNPDGSRTTSIGLFQQQDWWGSVEQRMDPAAAATLFYQRLARLPDWQQLAPTLAIHGVQVNTDAEYYARFQPDATAVVDALTRGC
ncbi:MAG: hypothetical protein J7484_03930 [Microbacterium sp.]|nr:hypothetical protein [Microbacterium sp.]